MPGTLATVPIQGADGGSSFPDPVLELDPFATGSADGEVTFDLHRVEPRVIGNRSVEGYMERRSAPFSIEDLRRAHGGGVYDVVIRRPNRVPHVVKGVRISGDPIDVSRSSSPHLSGVIPSPDGGSGFNTSDGALRGSASSLEATIERAVDRVVALRFPATIAGDEFDEDDEDDIDRSAETVAKMVDTVSKLKSIAGEAPPPKNDVAAFMQSVPAPVVAAVVDLLKAATIRLAPNLTQAAPSNVPPSAAGLSPDAPQSPEPLLAILDPALVELAGVVKGHLETGEPSLAATAAAWKEKMPEIGQLITLDLRKPVLMRALEKLRDLASREGLYIDHAYLDRGARALLFFAEKLLGPVKS